MIAPDRNDPRNWDAATLEVVLHAALRDGDMPAVAAALGLMVTKDPRRAAELYDTIQLGLTLARES